MGLQHALAMIGGLITPPLLIGALAANDPTLTVLEAASRQNHLVASALIVTGICTIVHVRFLPLAWLNYLSSRSVDELVSAPVLHLVLTRTREAEQTSTQLAAQLSPFRCTLSCSVLQLLCGAAQNMVADIRTCCRLSKSLFHSASLFTELASSRWRVFPSPSLRLPRARSSG